MKDDGKIPCEECALRDCSYFRPFEKSELDWVSKFKDGDLIVEPGSQILQQGHNSAHLYTLYSGMAFRYHMLEDGERQILNYSFPGDFLGLQSSMFGAMEHSVEALTECRLCVFPRDNIWELFKNHPGLAFDLTWMATAEERIVTEELTYLGKRGALERVAFLICMLHDRINVRTSGQKSVIEWPLNQTHIADTLGMTSVHVSRKMKELKDRELLTVEQKKLKILDLEKLREVAHYTMPLREQRPFL